tara:strand:+ start:557 stop:1780 length:1224 start_codon:yes stop_codon:yes gene_type:complete
MKTLQEQYNQIKNGKGSKEIFLKEAKLKYPNLIRNAANFKEAILALKGRSVISEGLYVANAPQSPPDWFKLFDENMNLISEEAAKALEKKTTKGVTDLQAPDRGYNYKDDKNINNVSGEQFRQGYFTELTDVANIDKTKQELIDLVIKNMDKNPQFYVEEAQFGIKGIGYTEEAPALGQGTEVKYSDGSGYGTETKKKSKPQNSKAYADKTSSSVFGTVYSDLAPKQPLEENKMISLIDLMESLPLGEKEAPKRKSKKVKKETTDSKLAEIENNGKVATLELQIAAIDEIISSKNERISMVTEDDSLSELVDKKKMKEMQREIKVLEKRKGQMEKIYEKMCGKAYKKVVTELDPEAWDKQNGQSADWAPKMEEGSNDNSNLNSNNNSNENSNSNPESYSGQTKFRSK